MKNILLLFSVLLISVTTFAQVDKNSDLYKTILIQDSLLFNIGFNKCDISQFENLLSENLEFYHDKNGISDKKKFLNDIKNGLCTDPEKFQSRRALLPGTTNIFALYNNGILYGAIQEGIHQFFEKQGQNPETFGSSAKFTHLWILENNVWKLNKALSFEHVKKKL